MPKTLSYVGGLVLAFALGAVTFGGGHPVPPAVATAAPAEVDGAAAVRPAYLIAAGRVLHPEQMQPYYAAAVPLAKAAGFEMVAFAPCDSAVVLEGDWACSGFVALERYRSRQALLEFYNSAGYQAAKQLREGHMQVDFLIAVEGLP